MFPAYCVMMTSRATIGEVAINTKPACTNQGFITCIPSSRLPSFYLYFWIRQNKEMIISLAGGATYKEINKTTFRKIPILVPSKAVSDSFVSVINPMFNQIENLQSQIENLRHTRDLLLPKLISGEIDAPELDILYAVDANENY
jgi:type I restriction enzyme S subunit